MSKNLFNQGGIIAMSLYSSRFDLISLTAVKLGDAQLKVDFLSTKGLICNVNTLTLDTNDQVKTLTCKTPFGIDASFNFKVREYSATACSYLNPDSTSSTTMASLWTWRLEVKAEITSSVIFARSFPSPNIFRMLVDYEVREPTPGALTLLDSGTNAYIALHGVNSIGLESYNCQSNCLACSNSAFPSGTCSTCKDVRNSPILP